MRTCTREFRTPPQANFEQWQTALRPHAVDEITQAALQKITEAAQQWQRGHPTTASPQAWSARAALLGSPGATLQRQFAALEAAAAEVAACKALTGAAQQACDAALTSPTNTTIWKTLGDAYRANTSPLPRDVVELLDRAFSASVKAAEVALDTFALDEFDVFAQLWATFALHKGLPSKDRAQKLAAFTPQLLAQARATAGLDAWAPIDPKADAAFWADTLAAANGLRTTLEKMAPSWDAQPAWFRPFGMAGRTLQALFLEVLPLPGERFLQHLGAATKSTTHLLQQVAGGAAGGKVWHESWEVGSPILAHFAQTLDQVSSGQAEKLAAASQQATTALEQAVKSLAPFGVGLAVAGSWVQEARTAGMRLKLTKLETMTGRTLTKSANKKDRLLRYITDYTKATGADWRKTMHPALRELAEQAIA